ncbi:MAG: hypothetical protein RJB66_2603 [Pseudomonadota bacterium]
MNRTINFLKRPDAILILLASQFIAGCLASAPKKPEPQNLFSSYQSKNKNNPFEFSDVKKLQEKNPFATQVTDSSQCRDRLNSGSYSEDVSPECVRSQTLRAYQALNLQMDPEVPYCILRQESSSVKNNNDPYQVEFNRLAVCKNKNKMCGVGLAQFTFGTWSGYERIIRSAPEKEQRLTDCLNALSKSTTHPLAYSNISIAQIKPSKAEDLLQIAKTKPPTTTLSPFYRDHAICMNALHLSEMPGSGRVSGGSYAIVGKANNRRQIRSTASAAQAHRLGAIYNGGGTAGYGASIGRCVAAFREYDNNHNVASNSFYLIDLNKDRAIASSDANETNLISSGQTKHNL